MVRNALVMWQFVLFGRGVFAAVPIVTIDNKDILCIQVVVVELTYSFLLIL